MNKMKLNLEQLAVESFETAAGGDESGTVHGHASGVSCPLLETCNGVQTCWDGCPTSSLLTQPEPNCPSSDPSSPVICPSSPHHCPSYPEICG